MKVVIIDKRTKKFVCGDKDTKKEADKKSGLFGKKETEDK